MPDLRGRCLCGSTVLRLRPPVDFVSHCHCESCRRAHGAAFVTWLGIARERCTIRTETDAPLGSFESSPGAFRSFCTRCGTPLAMRYTSDHAEFGAETGPIYIPLAVMLDDVGLAPQSHVSFEERVPWFPFEDALPCFVAKSDETLR